MAYSCSRFHVKKVFFLFFLKKIRQFELLFVPLYRSKKAVDFFSWKKKRSEVKFIPVEGNALLKRG